MCSLRPLLSFVGCHWRLVRQCEAVTVNEWWRTALGGFAIGTGRQAASGTKWHPVLVDQSFKRGESHLHRNGSDALIVGLKR